MRSWNRATSSRIKERSTLRLVLFTHSIDFMNERVIFFYTLLFTPGR